MQFQFICVLCTIFCVCGVKCQCKKQDIPEIFSYGVGLRFPSKLKKYILHTSIYCYNITSSTIFDYNYQNDTYPQHLFIDSTTSNVGILHSNSSISRFAGITNLFLKNIGLEIIVPGVFENLKSLERIDASFNRLRKISSGTFNDLENLIILSLSRNSIEIIEVESFSGLAQLHTLDLRYNKLNKLDGCIFRDLVNLIYLLLTNNNIITADFDYFPKILICDLSNNSIRSIENLENSRIHTVVLHNNDVTEIEIPQNVLRLQINHNKITDLINKYSDKSKEVIDIDLSFNEISALHFDWFRQLKKLTSLDLSNNKITVIHENAFVECSSLKFLNLSYNAIQNVEPKAFRGVSVKVSIDLSYNNLKALETDVFSENNKEVQLVLEGNEINNCINIKNLLKDLRIKLKIFQNLECTNVDISNNQKVINIL